MAVLIQFRTHGVNTAGHSKARRSVLRNNHADRYENLINYIVGIQYDTIGESYVMWKLRAGWIRVQTTYINKKQQIENLIRSI
jgi:hypothetical protein